jgi:hypothetical protein
MGVMEAVIGGTAILNTIGGFMSGSEDKETTQRSEPWGPQQGFLIKGFEEASGEYDQARGRGLYGGPFAAPMNDNLRVGADRMVGFSGLADGAGGILAHQGLQGVNSFGGVVNNAQNLFNRSMMDPTGSTIANAGQFANNPYASGLIDASLRDVNRNLQLGIGANNANAAGTGNMNSTRAGVTEGLLVQGAQDRAADISSQVRSGLFNQGLGLAANQHQQGMANGLAANAQNLAGVQAGAGLVGQGLSTVQGGIQSQVDAGNLQRGIHQQLIDGNLQKDTYDRNTMMDLIAKYQNIVGGQQYGNTVTTTQPGGSGIPQAIQGGVGSAAQMMGLARMGGYNPFGAFGSSNVPLQSANLGSLHSGMIY